jgi:hypothetical protein
MANNSKKAQGRHINGLRRRSGEDGGMRRVGGKEREIEME